MPEGAFFAYAGCAGLIGRRDKNGKVIDTDSAVADYLLHEAGVAVVPGSAFGLGPFLRLSYAASTDALEKACAKIEAACAALR
jgi:aspartate aminotransferase